MMKGRVLDLPFSGMDACVSPALVALSCGLSAHLMEPEMHQHAIAPLPLLPRP